MSASVTEVFAVAIEMPRADNVPLGEYVTEAAPDL
jgi:hypothetical protein